MSASSILKVQILRVFSQLLDVAGNGYIESDFLEFHIVTPYPPLTREDEADPDRRTLPGDIKYDIAMSPALGAR